MYCYKLNCHSAAWKACRDCGEFFCHHHIRNMAGGIDPVTDYVCAPCFVTRKETVEARNARYIEPNEPEQTNG